jgi:hypothetical protein
MKDNKTTEKKIQEQKLSSYQILREKLNDRDFAFRFQREKLQRCKDLIDDILAVCSGGAKVTGTNNEWANGHFLELFEIFSIRHENFERNDLFEHLGEHIYNGWTRNWLTEILEWRRQTLAERGLDERGIELPEMSESDLQTNDAPEYSDEFYFNQMGERLVAVLEHPEVPEQTKDALLGIADNTIQESGIDSDTSYYIRTKFPKAMFALEGEYSKAVMHSLKVIMENGIPDEIYTPILKKNLNR